MVTTTTHYTVFIVVGYQVSAFPGKSMVLCRPISFYCHLIYTAFFVLFLSHQLVSLIDISGCDAACT